MTGLLEEIIYFDLGNRQKFENDPRISLPKPRLGLSQGSPLSPLFSNIYLKDFDLEMKKACGKSMIRYVDDFIVITDNRKNAELIGKRAEELLHKEKLSISPYGEKTHIKDMRGQAINFLGLKLNRHKITTKESLNEIIRRITQETLNFNKYERPNHHYKEKDVVAAMNNKIQGWANYFKCYHTEDVFEAVNTAINRMKQKDIKLKSVNNINLKIIKYLISPEEWQSYF